MSGTLSSDSNDSVHNQAEVASQHASTVGTAGSKSSRSMAVLNTAVRHATDGFIGILDMFGFEDPKVNIDISNSQLHLRTSHLKNKTKTNTQKENLVDLIIIIFLFEIIIIINLPSLSDGTHANPINQNRSQPSQLEHLCINLCAETMQHFFNTHIFKSSIESCREEGIQCELEPDYVDNVPCIDLISSLVYLTHFF